MEVLHQLGAVQAALRKAARMIVDDHVEGCLVDALDRSTGQQAVSDLKQALQIVLR